MGKMIDITGQTFGKLTVLERDTKSKDTCVHWLCRCSCSNPELISIRGVSLRNGHTTSCGNCNKFEMIGKTFGRLTILEIDDQYKDSHNIQQEGRYYKCRCSCSNQTIVTVYGANLVSGHTKSCGCQRIQASKMNANDLSGQVFGFLKALYPTAKRSNGKVVWRCLCLLDNNECEVASDNLIGGHTKSCGCLRSVGEANIQKILQENNIIFEKEKSFDSLINPETSNKLRYDFYLPDYNRLIEFDGMQHQSATGGWNNQESFEKRQKLDKLKNNFAKQYNIQLIRIPYKEKDSITIDMLLGDQYLL